MNEYHKTTVNLDMAIWEQIQRSVDYKKNETTTDVIRAIFNQWMEGGFQNNGELIELETDELDLIGKKGVWIPIKNPINPPPIVEKVNDMGKEEPHSTPPKPIELPKESSKPVTAAGYKPSKEVEELAKLTPAEEKYLQEQNDKRELEQLRKEKAEWDRKKALEQPAPPTELKPIPSPSPIVISAPPTPEPKKIMMSTRELDEFRKWKEAKEAQTQALDPDPVVADMETELGAEPDDVKTPEENTPVDDGEVETIPYEPEEKGRGLFRR